jgi:hypothetical protein
MARGFIVNDENEVGITSTGYGPAIRLKADATADPLSVVFPLPAAGYLSHMEIVVDQTALVTATIRAFLSWDEGGDNIFMGPTAATDVVSGQTDTGLVMTSIKADVDYRAPTPQTTPSVLYLWLKTDVGTVQVTPGNVRLHWADRRSPQ